jgi:hypothetical protein
MTFDDTSYVKIMKLLFYYIEEENHRYSVLGYRIDAGPGKLQSCPFYYNLLSCSFSLSLSSFIKKNFHSPLLKPTTIHRQLSYEPTLLVYVIS